MDTPALYAVDGNTLYMEHVQGQSLRIVLEREGHEGTLLYLINSHVNRCMHWKHDCANACPGRDSWRFNNEQPVTPDERAISCFDRLWTQF